MSLFCFPSAASSTIRARCTSLTLVSFERTSLVSSPRSSSVNTISVATRTIAPNYLAVVLMTLPNPDKFHQEQNTTLGASALGLVAAQLGTIASANAQESNNHRISAPGTAGTSKGSFGPLKHVNAGVLSIAYAEAGPADGPPGLLFHGWPSYFRS